MSGEIEAVGTAIEGALYGNAVEPDSGRGADESHNTAVCLNCQQPLTGPYCAGCGQQAHVHRTISAIWHDILHSVLHFDGKFWRTLPLLAFKPGELTRRYIHGERAKFISPMAIFLFAFFLMYAVFNFTGTAAIDNSWKTGLHKRGAEISTEIAALEKQLIVAKAGSTEATALNSKLGELKSDLNGINWSTKGVPYYDEDGKAIRAGNSSVGIPSPAKAGIDSETGVAWIDRFLTHGGAKLVENPSLAMYKIRSNGYKFSWLLIPLSIPFIWLVTLGVRGHRFYDHAVFVTYSITFMCFLFMLFVVLETIGAGHPIVIAAFMLIPPIHLYKQLRDSYGLTRVGAVLRLLPLIVSTMTVSLLFLLILTLLGMTG